MGTGDAASHSPTPKHLISSPSSTPKKARRQASSPQLVALGELEFRKAFLILSYIGELVFLPSIGFSDSSV